VRGARKDYHLNIHAIGKEESFLNNGPAGSFTENKKREKARSNGRSATLRSKFVKERKAGGGLKKTG